MDESPSRQNPTTHTHILQFSPTTGIGIYPTCLFLIVSCTKQCPQTYINIYIYISLFSTSITVCSCFCDSRYLCKQVASLSCHIPIGCERYFSPNDFFSLSPHPWLKSNRDRLHWHPTCCVPQLRPREPRRLCRVLGISCEV